MSSPLSWRFPGPPPPSIYVYFRSVLATLFRGERKPARRLLATLLGTPKTPAATLPDFAIGAGRNVDIY